MLKVMRKSFQHLKWTLWLVVFIFVAFIFVDWGMGRIRGDRSTSTEVATINGQTISTIDFSRQYRLAEESYRQRYKENWTPALAKALDLPSQVLNGMIDRRLMTDAALQSGLTVSDAELAEKIQSYPAFQKNGEFIGARAYKDLLAANGLTTGQFERDYREDILVQKFSRLVAESLVVADSEVEAQFARQSEKAKIEYVLISPDHFGASAAPSDSELLAYFNQNKEHFRQPERRKIKYLLVEESRLREALKPSAGEVRSYFEAHKSEFATSERVHAAHILIKSASDAKPADDAAARKKAEDLAARAKKGEDFAELARKNSEDPGSKDKGGDLSNFGRGMMTKPFEDAAFSMAPGEIRGPIKTSFGYHVIKLLEKVPPGTMALDEATPRINSALAQSAVKAASARRAEALEKSISKSSSDEDLRKLAGNEVTFEATGFLTSQGIVTGLGYAPNVLKTAFQLKKGEVALQAVSTPRGPVIVKTTDILPPGLPEYSEVKEKVAAEYTRVRGEQRALEGARPLGAELQKGTTLADLAKRYGTTVQTPAEFAKGSPIPALGASDTVSDAVFKTASGQLGGPVSAGAQGVVFFRVVSKTEFDRAAFEARKESIKQSLREQEAQKLIQAEMTRRRTNEKVVVNEEFLKTYLRG
jgi:peptidyl-prolyl cis-trans isomerase D